MCCISEIQHQLWTKLFHFQTLQYFVFLKYINARDSPIPISVSMPIPSIFTSTHTRENAPDAETDTLRCDLHPYQMNGCKSHCSQGCRRCPSVRPQADITSTLYPQESQNLSSNPVKTYSSHGLLSSGTGTLQRWIWLDIYFVSCYNILINCLLLHYMALYFLYWIHTHTGAEGKITCDSDRMHSCSNCVLFFVVRSMPIHFVWTQIAPQSIGIRYWRVLDQKYWYSPIKKQYCCIPNRYYRKARYIKRGWSTWTTK